MTMERSTANSRKPDAVMDIAAPPEVVESWKVFVAAARQYP
jgi:hypothetical protein